jgi:hypothetical protein
MDDTHGGRAVPIEDHAHAVVGQRRHAADGQAIARALVDATDYAVRELQDTAEPGPGDFRRLLQVLQTRWPILGPDDRAFAAGYGIGVIEERDRLLAKLPTAGHA